MTDTRNQTRRAIPRLHAGLWGLLTVAVLVLVGTAQSQGFDIDEVFPCSEPEGEENLSLEECQQARELIMFECSGCHTVAPIVQAQNTPEEWESNFDRHSDRVEHLSDDELALIHQYLVDTFNPDNPVPELPDALKDEGSNQAF